jgi:hypothetical protein
MFIANMKDAQIAALEALLSEREYQDAQLGNAKRHEGQPPMTPGEYILCMEKCLQDAREAWYKPNGGTACLEHVRKVGALAMASMELHGAPIRELPRPLKAPAKKPFKGYKAADSDDDEDDGL